MTHENPQLRDLERESYRIVGMICSEACQETEIRGAIDGLRRQTAQVFAGDPLVFERIYARRFARLMTRFRPAPGLFSSSANG